MSKQYHIDEIFSKNEIIKMREIKCLIFLTIKLVFTQIPELLKYLPVTLEIAVIAIIFGLLFALANCIY